MRLVTDVERRRRLAVRHALAPGHRAGTPEAATAAMTVLHATEAPSVYLSLWARVEGITVADVDRALYDDRSLVKQLAMRRTLFVFPRDLLPAAWGSASARVAAALRARLVKEIEQGGIAADGAAWLEAACAATLARLADGSELSAQQLRAEVAELDGRLDIGKGKYAANVSVAPRVLTQLGVEARIVRGRNAGHWRTARPQWTLAETWLGELPEPAKEREGYAELVRRWLRTFGPGTEADLVWWLGSTKSAVRSALADVGAVQVGLEAGGTGWLLGDDLDEAPEVAPWPALLPVLDPTVMGWKERAFYLGDHGPMLFDTNGNAGTTAWWDGRIVGCWTQDPDGVVVLGLLEDVGTEARTALEAEAARLTGWLAGHRVSTVYPSIAMKAAVAP
ncbi:winged helix DNA-binding domain-containing protein [Nocardioides sp. MAH-18]|uniref:Winged helix DNA-binding domain-containing protein n=1 Tax=Nocardioides agri TaxID=2682843 RepID=A0A6L6XSD6_9ACTN|nr:MULTISPECIES: winged helix DNA-binding domain-containing protein [unclassified Nocardioides]MBA2953671.1 winged helix DNA-binding domain-containing protein [Nocardioides sp. CGMCC 1.13656]MVQ48535.1 winged helix DNA-binding domain-containing protein [Nocardioides sp. MAH-18]